MPQHPAFAEGRTAVITGGASGIGLAAAKRFAALGMKICLADLSQEALDRAAEQLSAASVLTVPTDVSKMEEVQRLKERVYADFGEVAVLMKVSVARQLGWGNSFTRLLCCPLSSKAGREKAPSVR